MLTSRRFIDSSNQDPGEQLQVRVLDPASATAARELAGQQGAAVLVVARQSKSVVLGVWEVAQLVDSNMQLTAVTETRDGEEDYVVSRLGHWANLVYDPVNN